MQTLLYSTDDVSPLEILGSKALQHLIDDAKEMFEQTEAYVEEMETAFTYGRDGGANSGSGGDC